MRIIALIEELCVIQRILKNLAAWEPRPNGPGPPTEPAARPSGITVVLPYHSALALRSNLPWTRRCPTTLPPTLRETVKGFGRFYSH